MQRRFRVTTLAFAALTAALAGSAAAQTSLTPASPFLPPAGSGPAVATAELLEFTGVSILPKQTLVSIFNSQERRGRWVAVGSSAEGIEVLNYDAGHDQVSIRYGGQLKVLTLRKPSKVANSGWVAAQPPTFATPLPTNASSITPVIPVGPRKPLTIAQQEEEARMFVADMLDIGMQNRKAYEEAQKKAAADKKNGTTPDSPAAVVPTNGG